MFAVRVAAPAIVFFHRARSALTVAVVSVVCLLCLLLGGLGDELMYRRSEIISGDYWRFISGHFVHSNAKHLLLNLAALWLIWIYAAGMCRQRDWLLLLLLCAFGTSVGLWFLDPEIRWYTGLSGVLHGLLLTVTVVRLLRCRSDYSAWFILLMVVGKLGYEYFYGATALTADFIALPVVEQAHLYGAMSGVLAAAMLTRGHLKRLV